MKKVISALAAVLSLALGAVETELLKFVPADYEAAVLVDTPVILRLSAVKELLAGPECSAKLAVLEQAGVKVEDIGTFMSFSCEEWSGGVFRLSSGKALKNALDNSVTQLLAEANRDGGKKITASVAEISGHRVYCFSNNGRPVAALVFLSDNLVAYSDADGVKKFFAAPKLAGAELDGLSGEAANFKSTAWGVWRNLEPAPTDPGKKNAGRVERLLAALNFSGPELRVVDAETVITCNNANYAAMLGMMIPGYLSIGSGAIFADAPKLGEEFVKSLKSNVDGNNLNLSLHLSEKLSQHIYEFLSTLVKTQMAESGADSSAPATTAPAAVPSAK